MIITFQQPKKTFFFSQQKPITLQIGALRSEADLYITAIVRKSREKGGEKTASPGQTIMISITFAMNEKYKWSFSIIAPVPLLCRCFNMTVKEGAKQIALKGQKPFSWHKLSAGRVGDMIPYTQSA